eukprot:XP_011419198.1 PREDICTED: uncharacterized protein LOC105322259 isoform X2 [Crassostrea gigas]
MEFELPVQRKKKPSSDFQPGGEVLLVVQSLLTKYPSLVDMKRRILPKRPCYHKTSGMNSMSLVVGEGPRASDLRYMISKQTLAHEIRMCRIEEAFEACNAQCYLLIWAMIDLPVSQEMLSITTSIRYASSCNRSTVIIGVSEGSADVDLRLHGVDEMIFQPLNIRDIRDKYTKWTSAVLIAEEKITPELEVQEFSNPGTPSTPVTPATPSTPASESGDGSGVTISMDSGIESPALSQCLDKCLVRLPSFSQLKAMVPKLRDGKVHKSSSAIDHTTKEKVRRERIKDSCDQLRVLLPYVRGRKTDMASILEMCVEYLKLVNEALPQEFQNQIAELMAKGPVAEGNSKNGKRNEKGGKPVKLPLSPGESNLVTSSMESDQIHEETSKDSKLIDKMKTGFKRDLEEGNGNPHQVKRIRIQSGAEDYGHMQKPLAVMPPFESLKVPKTENAFPGIEHTAYAGYPYHQLSPQMLYNEYDQACRMYSAYEGYLAPPFYTSTTPNKQQPDREGVYMDNQMLFHFYGNGALANNYNIAGVSDYVNPNAVLPLAYSKIKVDDHEEHSPPLSQP